MASWRSLDDAAEQTGIGRRTLQRWIAEGRLTAYTLAGDRKTFVDLEEIEKLRQYRPKERRPRKPPSQLGS